jgi:hypothetical protein
LRLSPVADGNTPIAGGGWYSSRRERINASSRCSLSCVSRRAASKSNVRSLPAGMAGAYDAGGIADCTEAVCTRLGEYVFPCALAIGLLPAAGELNGDVILRMASSMLGLVMGCSKAALSRRTVSSCSACSTSSSRCAWRARMSALCRLAALKSVEKRDGASALASFASRSSVDKRAAAAGGANTRTDVEAGRCTAADNAAAVTATCSRLSAVFAAERRVVEAIEKTEEEGMVLIAVAVGVGMGA